MSFNLLQPRASDVRGSDTLSEISESGTTNSGWTSGWDSREDLRDFVTKIGLKDSSELYKDRFSVDRKKFEQMLSGDNEAPLPADVFFEQVLLTHKGEVRLALIGYVEDIIMAETNTFITWPSKLKVGAKSRKDPHVGIAGREDDVAAAKERIMSVLYVRSNRVTMKMDVSYTDHSHIIGKGGLSIRRVMEETQCHVHFPDSNRSNTNEKSNQVTIAGDMQGVELARSRVRQKTPAIFGFELPVMSRTVDLTESYLVKIQEQYGVQIIVRTRPKLHATLVLVKGVEWEIEQVMKATMLAVEYLCQHLAAQTPIQMTMEISPMHHAMVIGKHHQHLKDIMLKTGAKVLFPDAHDPNIPILKKSNVTITGNIHDVYAARQLLTGSLPLMLMFDLPGNATNYKSEELVDIQNQFDVTVSIRHKSKQNRLVCIIKGAERYATNIYHARNVILQQEELNLIVDIPASYMPMRSQNHDLLTPTPLQPDPSSPVVTSTWQLPSVSFGQSQAPALPSFMGPAIGQQTGFPFKTASNISAHHDRLTPTPIQPDPSSPWQFPSASFGQSQAQALPQFMGPAFNTASNASAHNTMGSSGYHSLEVFSMSSMSLEQGQDRNNSASLSTISSTGSLSNKSSPAQSPRKQPYYQRKYGEQGLSDLNIGEYTSNEDTVKPSDFEMRRKAGFLAMQNRPTGNQFRYPNSNWAGYGISHTSPAPLNAIMKIPENEDDEVWKSPTKDSPSPKLNNSNLTEHTSTYVINRILNSKWPDLPSLLTSIGCEKYIPLFNSHEVDLEMFASISDKDLVSLGVNIFGCRRRMLLAIAELNKMDNPFSPAPGAERKASSSSAQSWPTSDNTLRDKW